eukprot:m.336590 g.336590  ORF g.336590 m.336590 type:complete len:60 (-) comp19797_c0_seq6:94-273(-)
MDKILGKLKPLIRVGSGGGLLSEDVVPEFLRCVSCHLLALTPDTSHLQNNVTSTTASDP